MAKYGTKGFLGTLMAGSILFSSTSAAAVASADSHHVVQRQLNPWGVLAALSGGAPAVTMCGAAAAASVSQAPTGCVLPVLDVPEAAVTPEPAQSAIPPSATPVNPLLAGLPLVVGGLVILLVASFHKKSSTNFTAPISAF